MAKDLANKVKQLREERDLSQSQVARELGMSRPTYMQIEKGERELTVSEIRTLAALFGVPIGSFLEAEQARIPSVVLERRKPRKLPQPEIRISVPQSRIDKFKEVLLYVLARVGAKPSVGETVIYKLLYFIDFDYYEKFEEQLVGATYIKNRYGPTPVEFKSIVEDMEELGEIVPVRSKHFQYPQKKYVPNREPDLSKLTAQEVKHIDEVLARLSDRNANELSAYSHQDVPWMIAEDGRPLDYEAVFYRTNQTSVRNYDGEDSV